MAPSVKTACEAKPRSRDHIKEEKYAAIEWEGLGFDVTPTDFMYVMKCSKGELFSKGSLIPYGNIELSPFSGVLNYGQGLFEGLKAYRREDDVIQIFRPEENAKRMKMGAERMCMSSPSVDQFIDAVKQTVLANKRFVPPPGKGVLYVRPLLMGSGPILGTGPAPECTFLVYASPVGNSYFNDAQDISLVVEDKVHRAIPGGTGGVKSITNYSPVYQVLARAKANGFSDVLFLDSVYGRYVEEACACNIFMLKGNVISTPAISQGTILPGITRSSVIEIARSFGYQVEERLISIDELIEADEAFCTGTAVTVNAIGSITYGHKQVAFKTGKEALYHKLYKRLIGIQTGKLEDNMGWTIQLN